MKSVTYKAPAKVILSGEHAVVYGKPALISGLGKFIHVTVTENESTPTELTRMTKPIIESVHTYLQKNTDHVHFDTPGVSVENEIPIGRGLGSSAAFAVALTASLLHYYTGNEPDKNIVNTLAYKAEKHFHGTPSGADNTTCCFGGLIFYRKEFEFLKTISALNCKLPETIESHLMLIDTGKPKENTSEMVKLVRIFYNEQPEETERILNKIEKITKRMVVSVIKEDTGAFRESIADNQVYLEKLNLISETSKKLLHDLRDYGVGKVTGAGGTSSGSGYILFYADNRKEVEKVMKQRSIPFIHFTQDFHGVQYQKSG